MSVLFGCFRKDLNGTLHGTDYLGRPPRTCPARLAGGELERKEIKREILIFKLTGINLCVIPNIPKFS